MDSEQEANQLKKSQPKVLFVDDEESILAAARRLFRGKPIEVLTASSPHEALKLLEKEDCWVIISDYRMPEMTGTELLEQVKKKSPQVSRLMLTGFLELPIVHEAVNRASVFRFITKPWDETDLLLGVETAIQHSGRQRTNAHLIHEISAQNRKLEEFTQNLETEVLNRTQGIDESKKMAEGKQRLVRDLTGFVKNLSIVNNVPALYEVIYNELRKFSGVSVPCYMLVLDGNEGGKLYWIQSRTLHERYIKSVPKQFHSLSVRTSSAEDRRWWIEQTKKECHELVAIPVRTREAHASMPAAVLFAEHSLESAQLTEFLDRITERLQPVSIVLDNILLREQLVAATRQWEATFNGFNDPIAVVDQNERVIRANSSFFKEGVQATEPTSNLVRSVNNKTFRLNSYPINNESDEHGQVLRVVNHYMDVSNERELYMRLVQSEKLAAVGLLAGNIAHELNNPLSGIIALAQILQKELPATDPHTTDLAETEKAAFRCQLIIKNLLNFSEPSNDNIELINVNEVVESTMPLLKTALRMQSLHTYYEEGLGTVKFQTSQLQQVIFNLINNACQAMNDGGVLTIKTWKQGSHICISITDTGPGIPDEIQSQIFEPFFTTKGEGAGTGLGLSVSKNIIEKFGGLLKLNSTVGQGTTFTIMLPSGRLN
ncbi:MAG: ATP-binding protein [Oligoflexia bacterium]|nr:ATP-binding protein [Oligoflexia bacterium]